MKFIHAADVHLDSPLRGLQSYEGVSIERIRDATRRAFVNLIDFALAQRVDLLLIAGDLYDGDWKDHHTGLFLASQLVKLRNAGIRTFMISGNHDAANRMTHSLRLPANCDGTQPFLPHDRVDTVVLEDLGVAIHGRGFSQQAEFGNLVDAYPAAISPLLNIGLLHTSLAGAEGHEPYAPCSVEQLCGKGYDYWALGHVHQRSVFPQPRLPSHPWIVFPGNLQGRHIRETGAKGCMLVQTENARIASVDFEPLDVVRWQQIDVVAGPEDQPSELEAGIRSALRDARAKNEGRMLAARVVISGITKIHNQLLARSEQWTSQIRCWALEEGGADIWIEGVKLLTQPVRQAAPADTDLNGPLAEIAAFIAELKLDPRALASVLEHFQALRRKLPDDIFAAGDLEKAFTAEGVVAVLDEVEPLLLGQLMEDSA